MVVVPASDLRDLLVTDRAESSLLFPEGKQLVFPFEGRCYLNVKAFFKVAFPRWVIRVRFPLYFEMPLDWHMYSTDEISRLCFFVSEEHPVISLQGCEVFLRLPCLGFSSVPSIYPPPDGLIDHPIYGIADLLTDTMPVVVRPSSNNRVEFGYQCCSRERFVGLHDLSDFLSECFHVLFGGGNQQFVLASGFVLAYVLSEEIQPLLTMCDDGLLW